MEFLCRKQWLKENEIKMKSQKIVNPLTNKSKKERKKNDE